MVFVGNVYKKILTKQLKPAKLVELPLENSNDSN
jgi:hypothetical protein